MADFLAVPLKKPSEVDIATPLKNLIQSRYSTADKPEDCSDAINELAKLRNSAVWKAFEKFESSLDVICSYYDQLVALETKIPPHEVQVPFKWKDAFDKGSLFAPRMSLTIPSLSYERLCVLFNIGALQSWIASNQTLDSDDGLKLAAKLFQQSASVFSHLKATVMSSIQQDPTPDLHPDTLGALASLMLAQAQEIFVHKAIHDNMKDAIVAKLAAQCDELYGECAKIFQRENLKHIWDKEWIQTIIAKQIGFNATAQLYQSLVCNASKMVGEEISRLTNAVELFKQCQSPTTGRTLFQNLMYKAERNLTTARKDNDFIYHERIPDLKAVKAIDKAQPAKITPLSSQLSQNFQDLFHELVPVPVHQALAAYEVRKNEIVNVEIGRLREATTVLNGLLASLNLPAAIETTDTGSSLPPSILEKAHSIAQLGGINSLESMLNDLPELLKRNREILNESDRLLVEEKDADDKLRREMKDRWSRTPSEQLTQMFRSNGDKYRDIINTAVEADKVVREKFNKHCDGFSLLSKTPTELQAAVPKGGNGKDLDSLDAVVELRKLMEDVATIKAERDVIEAELKSATFDMKSSFLGALAKDGAINEAPMSVETLGKTYGPLQKQVRENVERQTALIDLIKKSHGNFVRERGTTAGGRENMMVQLAAAYDAFKELYSNLKEGTKFYNDLTELLVAYQNKISDYCFARKTEKEELLKDIAQEKSRQTPGPTPSTPAYHGPIQPAPAASNQPPPNATAPNLPYPMYANTMPVPYGAVSAAPYPPYMPPPMPQGYNPYGTLPYPSGAYTYPGGYPGPQGYPGGYPYPQQQPQGGFPPQ